MSSHAVKKLVEFASIGTLAILLAPAVGHATNGTWAQTNPGTYSWDDTINNSWLGNTPADGAGFTANFNTVNPLGDITVNLDVASHSIGSIIFGDTDTSSAAGWTIGGINGLTMDTGVATPATVTVNALGAGKVVTINSPFTSSSGFTKAGVGTLVLTNATNSISSGITVSGGTLQGNITSLGANDILDNANITFDQAVAGTYSNTVSGGGTLTKIGAGVLTVANNQTYTGATIVNAGGLTVNGTLASQSLNLGGGTLTLALTSGNPVNFTNGTTVNGPSSLNAAAVTGTVALGAISRTSGGAANFVLPTTAPGVITTTSGNTATGILGGWATVGGSDYAISNAGTIGAYTGYTNDVWAAGNNTKITLATSSQSAATTNTLRIGGDSAADRTFSAAAVGATITVDANTGLQVGAVVTGTSIPADTRITAINGTTVTLSRNVTAVVAGPATLTYGASGPTAVINLTGTNTVADGGILTNVFSPAVTFNGGSLTGASGGGDLIFHQFGTASGNTTVNSTIADNGGPTGIVKAGTGTVILGANSTYSGNTTIGAGTLQVGNGGSSGSINLAGNVTNNGTLAFNHSGSLAFTKQINGAGATSFNGGLAVTLDFTAATAPTTNLLTTGAFTLTGGGSLNVVGKAGATNSQTFASSTFGTGLSTITVANGSGGTATLNLGGLTAQIGSAVRFIGPTTQDATGSPVAATGFVNTSAAGNGGNNALGANQAVGAAGQGWGTVGLFDFAGTVADPVQTGVFNIVGGSQIPSFYTTTYPNATGSTVNFDMIANTTIPNGGAQKATGTIRFNTATATTLTSGTSNLVTMQSILITPNMGANNANFNASGGGTTGSGQWQINRSGTSGQLEGLVWQNNTNGFFNLNVLVSNGRNPTTGAVGTSNPVFVVKAGAGTMSLNNPSSVYTGGLRLLEGATLVPNTAGNGALGVGTISVASSSTSSPNVTLAANATADLVVGMGFLGQTITAVNGTAVTLSGNANQTIASATNTSYLGPMSLNGGALVGNGGSFALNTGGATPTHRPVVLQAAGGTLAATTGNRLTISGLVSNGVNNAGPLNIGTGVIAGTGLGTANTTALSGNGDVLLSGANTYTGGTIVSSGTLLVDNTAGSGTGTGSITVNSGGAFGGNGTSSGAVSLNSGGHLSPGISGTNSGIGTVTVGGASFLSSSVFDVDLAAASNDLVVSTNGLSVGSGTGVNLFQAGTSNPFQLNGTFTLFSVTSGGIPTPAQLQSNFSILNPAAGGSYLWGVSGTNVTLQISGLAVSSTWITNGGGQWGSGVNWNPVVPGNPGDSALFGNATTSGTAHITLDGDRTVGAIGFNDAAASYSIDPGTPAGNLILNNKTASASISDANGSHSIAANVVLSNDVNIGVTNAADALTIAGNISGSKNLNAVGGSGKVILTGSNSYVDTTISAGMTLQVGSGGASGTLGTGVITNNGTLSINISGPTALNQLTGGGTLVQAGSGTTTLTSATNAGAWNTTVNAGTLVVGTGSLLGAGTLTTIGGVLDLNGYSPTFTSLSGTGGTIDNLTAGGTVAITVNQTGNATFAGTISNTSGVVSLTKSGVGSLTLAGTGTYDGNTTITNGNITITSSTAVKAGTTIDVQTNTGLLLGNATVAANILLTLPQNTATQMFDVNAGSHATISGNITEAFTGGAQTRFNAGNDPTTTNLTITGNFTTTTGNTILERGSLILAGNSVFSSTGGSGIWFGRNGGSNIAVLLKDNAQLLSNAGLTLGGAAATGTASAVFTIQDNAQIRTTTGGFELNGLATVGTTVNFNGGTVQVTGFSKTAATPTTLTLNGTQIRAGAANANFLPAGTALTANVQAGGAKIDSNGFDVTVAAPLTHDPALDTVTPTPDGGLVKSGGGTLALQGLNTYTGPTTISGGTLSVQQGNGIASTNKVTLAGGKLDTFGGSHTFTIAPLQLTANSAIDMGTGASILQFANSSTTPWTTGSLLSVVNWTGTAGVGVGTDQLLFGPGGLTTGAGSQVSQIHFQGFNGATLLGSGEVVPTSVSTRVLGDWNVSGALDAGDAPAMLTALTDLNAWTSSHSLSTDDVLNIGDVNLSGVITNADIQAELDLLSAHGFGSTAAVPEPASFLLLGLGGVVFLARRRFQNRKLIAEEQC